VSWTGGARRFPTPASAGAPGQQVGSPAAADLVVRTCRRIVSPALARTGGRCGRAGLDLLEGSWQQCGTSSRPTTRSRWASARIATPQASEAARSDPARCRTAYHEQDPDHVRTNSDSHQEHQRTSTGQKAITPCTAMRRRTFWFHTARRNLGSSRVSSRLPGDSVPLRATSAPAPLSAIASTPCVTIGVSREFSRTGSGPNGRVDPCPDDAHKPDIHRVVPLA
jgi:hypothetical protein